MEINGTTWRLKLNNGTITWAPLDNDAETDASWERHHPAPLSPPSSPRVTQPRWGTWLSGGRTPPRPGRREQGT